MSEKPQTRSDCVLWIDHTNRIISFKKAEGFEAKVFPTREEKITYAVQERHLGLSHSITMQNFKKGDCHEVRSRF